MMTTGKLLTGIALGLGVLAGVAPARAAGSVDVCHEYAEARYQETLALPDESGFLAENVYGDAYDACAAGERFSGSGVTAWTVPAGVSLERRANMVECALIDCPWGYGEDNTECQ